MNFLRFLPIAIDARDIALPTSVPSGYARQAQFEASLKCEAK